MSLFSTRVNVWKPYGLYDTEDGWSWWSIMSWEFPSLVLGLCLALFLLAGKDRRKGLVTRAMPVYYGAGDLYLRSHQTKGNELLAKWWVVLASGRLPGSLIADWNVLCNLTEPLTVLTRADAASKGTDTELACSLGRWEREDALGTLSGNAAVCRGAAPWKSIPSLLGREAGQGQAPRKKRGCKYGRDALRGPCGSQYPIDKKT